MKKIVILALLLLIFFILNAENQITSFIGGNYAVTSKLLFPSIYSSKRIMENQNLYNSVSSFIENPAGLAYVKTTMYSSKIVPIILVDPDMIYKIYDSNGIEGKVANVADKVLDNFSSPDLQPQYPSVDILGGQIGGLQQLSVAFPNNYGTLGLNFQRDFLLDFKMNGNGANVTLEDFSEDEVTKVVLDVEMYADLEIAMNSANIGFGKRITDELSVGIGSSLINTRIKGKLDVLFEGMLRQYGGNADVSFAFNDPIDSNNFRNTLNSTLDCDLEAKSIKVFSGVNYVFKNYLFAVTFKSTNKSDLKGTFDLIQHTFGAVNTEALSAGSDEELVDATLFEMSKMTYTNRTQYIGKKIELYLPGKLELSINRSFEKCDLTFVYAKLLGKLAVHYKCNVLEDGREKIAGSFQDYLRQSEKDYTVGIKPQHLIKFGTRFILFKKLGIEFDGGLLLAEQVMENIVDKNGNQVKEGNLYIPLINSTCNIPISQKMKLSFDFLTFPNPVLQMMITYSL